MGEGFELQILNRGRKIDRLFSLRRKKKQAFEPCPRPSWSETVSIMFDKQLCYADEVVDVIYAPDKTKRFVLLKSDKGYFRFVYEELHPFTEEEWMYVSRGKTRFLQYGNPRRAGREPPCLARWKIYGKN